MDTQQQEVNPQQIQEFLRGLSRWLQSVEGRREAARWSDDSVDRLGLAKLLMRRYQEKVS